MKGVVAQPRGVSSEFLNFQQNIKRTAFGVKFARALFTGGNQALSEKFLREGFKQLGIAIPSDVEFSINVAQMIASGSATVDAIQAYESFDDIKSVTTSGANTLQLATRVLGRLGWLDEKSDNAMMIRTAGNIAMLVGSCGLDARAWVALAMDFSMAESNNQVKAQQIAQRGLMQSVQNYINPQAKAAASVLKEYQEKKISMFEFVGAIAESAPALWPQYFPELKKWMPLTALTFRYNAETTTWYGSSSGTQTASYVMDSLYRLTPDQIRSWVFTVLAEPTLYPFLLANQFYKNKDKASIKTLGIMGALGLVDFINTTDMSDVLIKNNLTLFDFHEDLILKKIFNAKMPGVAMASGITVDGVESYSKAEISLKNKREFLFKNKEILAQAEMAGRPDIVSMSEDLRADMSKALTFESITPNQAVGLWNESGIASYGRGESQTQGQISMKLGGYGASWRSVKNYFAALAMVDQLRRDRYFKDWNSDILGVGGVQDSLYGSYFNTGRDVSTYDFLGEISEFESLHREISFKMALRKVNTLALGNVAFFLGAEPKNLVRLNRNDQAAPAVYGRKG